MGRKNYLVEDYTKEEKSYLKLIILNTRRKYIRDNYNFINSIYLNLECIVDIEAEAELNSVLDKCGSEVKSAVEFEKIVSDDEIYNIVKVLSLKEKIVLFLLYKENKSINEIAKKMKLSRKRIWQIKNVILDKIMKKILGGEKNV